MVEGALASDQAKVEDDDSTSLKTGQGLHLTVLNLLLLGPTYTIGGGLRVVSVGATKGVGFPWLAEELVWFAK